MRKLYAFASILAIAAVATFFTACNNSTESKPEADNTIDSTKLIVERGHYLANYVAVCIDCHSKRDITKFSLPVIEGLEGGGGITFGEGDGVPGEVTPPNITPAALKDWTDEEIARAMTTGINKKGDTLFPMMPYHNYSRLAKDDIYAIIAYLRTLKPIDSTTPARKLMIPPAQYGPLPQTDLSKNIRPDTTDMVKYGEYVITMAACGECHTPRTPQGPDFTKAYAGGFVFKTPFFNVGVANITPDSTSGIGNWTETAFVEKFRTNSSPEVVNKNPGKQNSIMPWSMYGKMNDTDLKAIYAFLRTVPAVKNIVEKYPK